MRAIIIMLLILVLSVALYIAFAKPDFSYLPAQQREEVSKLYDQADQGDVNAQIQLARFFGQKSGAGHAALAIKWYKAAIAQNSHDAKYYLAAMYTDRSLPVGIIDKIRYGIELGLSQETASHLYGAFLLDEAAEEGSPLAQSSRGEIYNLIKDYRNAIKWYRLAAEQNNANAQYQLGKYYEKGYGTDADDAQAFTWYQKAAAQSEPNAQHRLGYFYLYGIETEKNYDVAYDLLNKSAAEDSAGAAYYLGEMYEQGWGVKKDDKQAFYYYSRAALIARRYMDKEDYPERAANKMAQMYFEGRGVEKDLQQAYEWSITALAGKNDFAESLRILDLTKK